MVKMRKEKKKEERRKNKEITFTIHYVTVTEPRNARCAAPTKRIQLYVALLLIFESCFCHDMRLLLFHKHSDDQLCAQRIK
jgi:hypothetical protein